MAHSKLTHYAYSAFEYDQYELAKILNDYRDNSNVAAADIITSSFKPNAGTFVGVIKITYYYK